MDLAKKENNLIILKINIKIYKLLTNRPPSVTIYCMCSWRGWNVTKSVTVNFAASVTVVVVDLYVKFWPAWNDKNDFKLNIVYIMEYTF